MKQFIYSDEPDEILRERTEELRKLPIGTNGTLHTYICFTAGENSYAVDSDVVLEVINTHGYRAEDGMHPHPQETMMHLDRQSILPLPHAPQFIPGILNNRGILYTVVDISMLLFDTPTRCTEHSQILLVRHQDHVAGILTENIAETLIIPLERVHASTETVPQELQNILTSAVPYRGSFIGLIQCPYLFEHPKLTALTQHQSPE